MKYILPWIFIAMALVIALIGITQPILPLEYGQGLHIITRGQVSAADQGHALAIIEACHSDIHTLILDNMYKNPKYYGLYYYGGKVIIYLKNMEVWDMDIVLTHELGHHYWFTKMTKQERLDYCEFIGMQKYDCEEYFADKFECKGAD